MEICPNFTAFIPNFAAFCLMVHNSPLSPTRRETVQVVRQVFQADPDFRTAEAFRKNLSALVYQLAHDAERVFDTAADS